MIFKKTKGTASFKAGDDTLIREVLHPRNDGLALSYSLAHASLEPGKASLPHVLRESSEVYYILQGQGLAVVGADRVKVEPGDLVYIPAGATQYMVNEGDVPLTFLCIVSPPWQKKDEEVIESPPEV